MRGLGGKRPNGRTPLHEGETVAAFLCLFGMSGPPRRKNYFLLRGCFIDKASREYTGREVWQELHRGGGIHQVRGYDAPQSVCDATVLWTQPYAPKGGRPTKPGHEVVVVESYAPPTTPKGKAPTPLPQAVEGGQGGGTAPPPPPRPLMWGPWRPVWPPMTRDGRLPDFGRASSRHAGGGRTGQGSGGQPQLSLVEGREGPGQH